MDTIYKSDLSKIYPARFNLWEYKKYASHVQLTFLSLGIDPSLVQPLTDGNGNSHFGDQHDKFFGRQNGILDAIKDNSLPLKLFDGVLEVDISDFVAFAERQKWSIPGELTDIAYRNRASKPPVPVEIVDQSSLSPKHSAYVDEALKHLRNHPNANMNSTAGAISSSLAGGQFSSAQNTIRNALFVGEKAPLGGLKWGELKKYAMSLGPTQKPR